MFNETFILLQQEAYLARATLLAGLQALRKANVDDINKGLFYAAFFQLAIGVERMMKIILVVDHMASNDLKPMTDQELKNKYHHRIIDLYHGCMQIAQKRNLSNIDFVNEAAFEYEVMVFLHEFALKARYYNLSQLTNQATTKDPLSAWWSILQHIITCDLPQSKLEKIQSESIQRCAAMGGNAFILAHDLNKQLMTTFDAIMKPRLIEAASPYSVWLVFKTISPLYHIINSVVDAAHKKGHDLGYDSPPVPYLEEFFPFLLLSRAAVMRRRKWA